MQPVDVDTFTTYEVADDGSGVRLNFQDNQGCQACVSIPMEALKTLTLSLPKIMLGVADRNIAPHLGSLTNQPVSA
jgi:hypothetical protein